VLACLQRDRTVLDFISYKSQVKPEQIEWNYLNWQYLAGLTPHAIVRRPPPSPQLNPFVQPAHPP
jgi:hypothetical protein